MTDAERRLWSRLRDRRLAGHKFRRQHPLGREGAKLAVEIDGGQHAVAQDRDAARTCWLAAHGCRVVRFWNHEVLQNTDGVLQRILEEEELAPP